MARGRPCKLKTLKLKFFAHICNAEWLGCLRVLRCDTGRNPCYSPARKSLGIGHPRSLAYYLNPSICHKTMANGINILTSPTNPVRSVTCTPLYKGLNVVAMDTGYRLDRKSHLVQDFFHRCYHQDLIAATRPLDSR